MDHGKPKVLRAVMTAVLASALLASGRTAAAEGATEPPAPAVPYPDGYVDFCRIDVEAAQLFPAFIPQENVFVGCATTPLDLVEWQNNVGGDFRSYLIATMVRGTANGRVSEAQFSAFANGLKQQMPAMDDRREWIEQRLDQSSAAIAETLGSETRTKVARVVALGFFDEGPGKISAAWIVDATHMIAGRTIEAQQVQVSSSLLIDGRVYVLFTYGRYEKPSDVERYKDIATAWAGEFLQSNVRGATAAPSR